MKFATPFVILLIYLGTGCQEDIPFEIKQPSYFPEVSIPDNNLLTQEKIELGERLFGDKNLSIDSTIMCSSCHKAHLALADSLPISPGVFGRLGERNSPSLINAAYAPLINRDGGVAKLDIQALIPIEDHNEMGISILKLSKRLRQNPSYVSAFEKAFDRGPDGFTIPRALASYVRSLVDASTPYDKYLTGQVDSLSLAAQRGLRLFKSEELACHSCHSGPLLTSFEFENNGLYEDYTDRGRALITLNDNDVGKFRIPSLRNVVLTAPYMHDGQLATLDDVIAHYASGGQSHRNKNPLLKGFSLTLEQRKDLLAFLEALTSERNFSK